MRSCERSLTRKRSHESFAIRASRLTSRDSVKLPKTFVAINLSEKVPHAFSGSVKDEIDPDE